MTTSVIVGSRRPQLTIRAVVAVLCLAITLAACGSGRGGAAEEELPGERDATAEDLDGHTFVATSVDGQTVVEGTQIRMTFTADSVSVDAGCNTMNGGYTIDDGTLHVDALAQTAMACPADRMAQDAWLGEFLQAGPDATMANDVLTLEHDDTTIVLGDSELGAISVPATVSDPAAPTTA